MDAYVKQGKEVISNYDAPLPPFMFDQIFTNVASTSSKGLELTLNWDVVNMKDFSYSTNLVASFTKSKLDKFSNGTYQKGYMDRYLLPAPGNPGYAQRLQDGVEIGSFYGLRYGKTLKLEEKKYSLMVKLVIQTKIILAMEHLDILCLGGIHFDIKDLI